MARKGETFGNFLAYLAVRLAIAVMRMFSVEANYRAVRLFGRTWWRFSAKHRRVARGHLRLSFPDWPEERIRRVARESVINLFVLGMEVIFTPLLITPNLWKRHIRPVGMTEALRLVLRRQTGAILLTGHFGNFEVIGYTLATLGFPTVSVVRPLDNPYVWDYMVGMLEKTGQSFLYKYGAMRSAGDVLTERGVLSVVADQNAGRKGMFVDFFGRPASTYKSIALLAMRYDVPILVGYGRRVGQRFQFEMSPERIIYPHEWADKDDAPRWITQEFTRALESSIRRWPEQYLWIHRRWRDRPDGTKAPGDGVA